MKNIWLLICAVSITCCNQKSENQNQTVSEIALPFYNEPTFTPEWIKETDEGFDEIHRIADFKLQNQKGHWITQEDLEGKIVEFFPKFSEDKNVSFFPSRIRSDKIYPNKKSQVEEIVNSYNMYK